MRSSTRSAAARRVGVLLAGFSLAVALGVNSPAGAAANPYERGPAPTEASVTASRGTFAVSQLNVPSGSATGFKNGTIYYPTSTTAGTFGAVAVIPGFVSPQAVIQWLGPRLASQGFVVFTLDSFNGTDLPEARGQQLLAALDYLTTRSSVRDRVDANRLAVMGHSMGGGGTLRATVSRPALQAAIPLAPWEPDTTWEGDRVPTMIIGAENDAIAPVASHAIPQYTSITAAPEKAYLELNDAGHLDPASESPTVGKYALSWLKRFVDDDTRYDQFLCPVPAPNTNISQYRGTCPNG
ncbi:dienelactone hydrolase family protein [Streptomyces sp. NPDC050535]|uniref:dienelactone hydrolase family protein n=1 Tax=Streptomyces sp. NPDC050535 TaxID=3365626 RepID=UPI00379F2A64